MQSEAIQLLSFTVRRKEYVHVSCWRSCVPLLEMGRFYEVCGTRVLNAAGLSVTGSLAPVPYRGRMWARDEGLVVGGKPHH